MPKENQYLIENKKPVELVQELEKYEIKKSPLSPAARGKVVNKSGSNYLSENEGYGPCTSSYCSCSSYELRRQLKQKQEDLDNLWEKFKEYDSKWEEYKAAVDKYFSDLENERDNPIRKVMDNPFTKIATEFIPMSGPLFTWKYDMQVQANEAIIDLRSGSGRRNCYSKIVDKYNQIKDWYYRIRNR